MSIQELWGGVAERSVDGLVWTRIEKVQSVTVPETTFEARDVTSLDTVGNSKEFKKGRSEHGPFEIICFSTLAGLAAAEGDKARPFTWYRLTFEDGSAVEAKCLATCSVSTDLESDSMITLTGTVTGDVTVTVGA